MKNSIDSVLRNLRSMAGLGLVLTGSLLATPLGAQGYRQTFLVSDLANVAAHTDTNLVNAWGLAIGAEGTLVVCATESSLAGFYRPDGRHVGDYIEVDEDPTGVAINPWGGAFRLTGGLAARPSRLLFVTEEGKIMGWNPHVDAEAAVVAVDNSTSKAVYKGLALAHSRKGPRLYATNFRGAKVEMYDGGWHLLGTFTDATVDAGFAPFNIANIGGLLFVTFAKQEAPDLEDDEPGAGNGFVDVFDLDGHMVRRFASHGPLNSPWGIAWAPKHFGPLGNALLIGNFGDGRINAFDPRTGAFLGALSDAQGNAIVTDGLWSLQFSHNFNDRDDRHQTDEEDAALYFTAGPADESHGVVGKIVAERRHH